MRTRIVACLIASCAALAMPAAHADEKPNRIERAAKKAADGAEKTARRTGNWAERTAKRAGNAVGRAARKTENWVRKALE